MIPTPLKAPDFKGFYSSHFAIEGNTTEKQDALLFTAEHLFALLSQSETVSVMLL